MKNLILLLIMAIAAVSWASYRQPHSVFKTETDAEPVIDGAWNRPGTPVITSKIKTLFDRAFESFTGVEYTPVAYLGSEVADGRNHRILCTKDSAKTPETYAIVTLRESLEGGIEISDIVNSEITTDFSSAPGSWRQADSPLVTDNIRIIIDEAAESFSHVEYTPVAIPAVQTVGGINYAVICEAKPAAPNAEPGYAMVYIFIDLTNNAEITDIVDFISAGNR